MTAGKIRTAIVAERVAWVRKMLEATRNLPLGSYEQFQEDPRTPAAAESHLRRALEALLDLGRHMLAKGFALAPAEYKEVADELGKMGVLSEEDRVLLRQMAGYRNRMVHFYHEVSQEELYTLCSLQLSDIERICEAMLQWLKKHPEKVDTAI
ncbi:MAG: DUF86 domain-containing protein [Desulfobacterales bacterium]|nr:DUF86 domain-containing protein [Desulfobacterales bacterium]